MISLRPVAEDDDEFLCLVYGSTREAELRLVDWNDAQKSAFVRMQFDAQRRYYEEVYAGASFDVVLADGTPAGRLYVARWPKEIRIVDIALLPAFRGRGIGTALLRELMAEGAASGRKVSIHVERFNPALGLYHRLGFLPIADEGVYILMEWSPGSTHADPNAQVNTAS